MGTLHPSIVPYGSYPTSDGHLIFACLTERFWHNFARRLGREDLIEDPRFSQYESRLANRTALEPIIHAVMTSETTAHWLDRLDRLAAFDVPSAPILSVGEELEQEHVAVHGLVETVSHPMVGDMRLVRGPIQFDGQGPAASRAPSLLGEDTQEVLSKEIGLSDEQIKFLIAKGIVKTPTLWNRPGTLTARAGAGPAHCFR